MRVTYIISALHQSWPIFLQKSGRPDGYLDDWVTIRSVASDQDRHAAYRHAYRFARGSLSASKPSHRGQSHMGTLEYPAGANHAAGPRSSLHVCVGEIAY